MSKHELDIPWVTPWQARQAAMLYEFSSIEYLKKLHGLVTQLIDGVVDPVLTLAAAQGRDALLTSPQWGIRNTSENWANNAWPFLKELQASLAKDIALRAFDKFEITAVNECLRGADQFSMLWATPQEEQQFKEAIDLVTSYAARIDRTFFPQSPRWNDFRFAYEFDGFRFEHPRIPKFRVRKDVIGTTGKIPPRTGVYIAVDDPHASLQFAASGNGGIALREACTFNELGLEALATVGRDDLWFNEQRMLDFAISSKQSRLLGSEIVVDGEPSAILAPSAVAGHAFRFQASSWYYVECLDEFEESAITSPSRAAGSTAIRLAGGDECRVAGFYFTPSKPNSRKHFKVGEILPEYSTQYGQTIWQWDEGQ